MDLASPDTFAYVAAFLIVITYLYYAFRYSVTKAFGVLSWVFAIFTASIFAASILGETAFIGGVLVGTVANEISHKIRITLKDMN